jgi:hypothetical protein
MKKQTLLLLFALCAITSQAQIAFTAAIPFCTGAPTGAPSASGSRFRIDLLTGKQYAWSPTTTSWFAYGQGFDVTVGGVPPAYTPGIGQSYFAVNGSNELYRYSGSGTTWNCLNCVTGATYTAGTGISINGSNVISNTGDLSATNELITDFGVSAGSLVVTDAGGAHNIVVTDIAPVQAVSAGTGISISGTSTRTITNSAPDQAVSITGAGINAVTGTYPTFTVTGTEVDGSNTNEIQNLSLTGQSLGISSGTGVTLPLIGVGAGTGISVSTAAGSATVTNTAPSLWTDGGATTYITATTDNVAIGTTTATAGFHNAINGALSTPAERLSGTWITGGTATTTKPILLIEPTGSSSSTWSTSGTGLGVNSVNGFAGN